MPARAYMLTLTTTMLVVTLCQPAAASQNLDSRYLEGIHTLPKRASSLSIVNPLDVLRQRIILEMARRQMRENTRQVETNKQLLRQIGKRDGYSKLPFYPSIDDGSFDSEMSKDLVNTGQDDKLKPTDDFSKDSELKKQFDDGSEDMFRLGLFNLRRNQYN